MLQLADNRRLFHQDKAALLHVKLCTAKVSGEALLLQWL